MNTGVVDGCGSAGTSLAKLRIVGAFALSPNDCGLVPKTNLHCNFYFQRVTMSKIAVLAKLTAAEGKRSEAVAVLSAQVGLVNEETGTEIYALHTDDSDEVTIWFYELYLDAEALALHSGSPAMAALGPKLKGLMAARPEIMRLSPVTAKGLTL